MTTPTRTSSAAPRGGAQGPSGSRAAAEARLKNKAALITGGGAGIGAATARLFCAEGAAVTLVDADAGALAATADAIGRAVPGARLVQVVADVSDEHAPAQAAQRTLDALGRLHGLVNNAPMRHYSALAHATP